MNEARCLRKDFCHSFCHEEVEGGDCLSAVLLVLVGLEDDGGKRSITLDALRRADAAVLGAEATFKEIVHVILDAGSRLCRVVIEVVNMDIAQLVRFGKNVSATDIYRCSLW